MPRAGRACAPSGRHPRALPTSLRAINTASLIFGAFQPGPECERLGCEAEGSKYVRIARKARYLFLIYPILC